MELFSIPILAARPRLIHKRKKGGDCPRLSVTNKSGERGGGKERERKRVFFPSLRVQEKRREKSHPDQKREGKTKRPAKAKVFIPREGKKKEGRGIENLNQRAGGGKKKKKRGGREGNSENSVSGGKKKKKQEPSRAPSEDKIENVERERRRMGGWGCRSCPKSGKKKGKTQTFCANLISVEMRGKERWKSEALVREEKGGKRKNRVMREKEKGGGGSVGTSIVSRKGKKKKREQKENGAEKGELFSVTSARGRGGKKKKGEGFQRAPNPNPSASGRTGKKRKERKKKIRGPGLVAARARRGKKKKRKEKRKKDEP